MTCYKLSQLHFGTGIKCYQSFLPSVFFTVYICFLESRQVLTQTDLLTTGLSHKFIKTTLHQQVSVSLYCFWWEKEFFEYKSHEPFSWQLSTVAPRECRETLNYYGCSALWGFFWFIFLYFNLSVSFLFVISVNLYLNIWYKLCYWFSTFIYCVIRVTGFMHSTLLHHLEFSDIIPWWGQLFAVEACIFAY